MLMRVTATFPCKTQSTQVLPFSRHDLLLVLEAVQDLSGYAPCRFPVKKYPAVLLPCLRMIRMGR